MSGHRCRRRGRRRQPVRAARDGLVGDDRIRVVCAIGVGEDTDGLRHSGVCNGSRGASGRSRRTGPSVAGDCQLRENAMTSPLMTIARMEFTAIGRVWWIRLLTVAYALLCVAMAYASGVIGETERSEAFARLTVAVLPLALTLVPLAALLIGVTGAATDDATGFLLSQPVSRRQHLVGTWLGQAAALTFSVTAGFGTGGAIVSVVSGANDFVRFGVLVAACLLAAIAFLSIATLIVAAVSRRSAAMGVAAFVWFVAVILYDAAMLSIAVWASGVNGAR